MQQMMERGWLGEKRGQGFYKRVGKGADKEIWALDRKTLEYHPAQKAKFSAVEAVRGIEDLGQRLRALVAADDRAGQFLWKLFRDFVIYSARMVPEISDRIVEIDRAMRWGYGIHARAVRAVGRARRAGDRGAHAHAKACAIPENVERMLASGAQRFYEAADRDGEPGTRYFDLNAGGYAELETRPGVIVLARHQARARRGEVQPRSLAGGPGRRRALPGVPQQDERARRGHGADGAPARSTRSTRDFQALVVANEGENFSVGANLMMVLLAAQEGEWDELDTAVRRFQAGHAWR